MVVPACTPFTMNVGAAPLTVATLGLSVANVRSPGETVGYAETVTEVMAPTGT